MNSCKEKCDIWHGQKLETWQRSVCVCNRCSFMSEKYQCSRCKVCFVHCWSFHSCM